MPKVSAKVFPQFYEPEWNICPACLHEFIAAPASVNLDWVEVAGDISWFISRDWHCPKCQYELSASEIVDETHLP